MGRAETAGGRNWDEILTVICKSGVVLDGHSMSSLTTIAWRVFSDEAHEKNLDTEILMRDLTQGVDFSERIMAEFTIFVLPNRPGT